MTTRLYRPDAQLYLGRLAVWREMFAGLAGSRELIWQLFVRDFLAKYKQSVLGAAWAVLMPVAVVAVFVFMNRAGILNVGETAVPYPAFALVGLTFWQLFATGVTAATNSIVAGGSIVLKVNFPKEALVFSAFAQSVFDFSVRVVLIAVVFSYFHLVPAWTTVFVPFALIPLVLLALALGLILSLLNCVARDTVNMVTLGTTFLLFITPVLYPSPASGAFVAVNRWNPLGHLISGSRDLLITGGIADPGAFAASSLLAALGFLAAWRLFYLVEPRMAERV